MKIYEWRRQQKELIVRVHYVEELECGYGLKQLTVFVERTRKLVESMDKFKWSVGIELLTEYLKGFWALSREFGFFTVTDGMIALDENNKPKVWVNINYARNTCVYCGNIYSDKSGEANMVSDVFAAMYPHFEPHPLLIKLNDAMKTANTFSSALASI